MKASNNVCILINNKFQTTYWTTDIEEKKILHFKRTFALLHMHVSVMLHFFLLNGRLYIGIQNNMICLLEIFT